MNDKERSLGLKSCVSFDEPSKQVVLTVSTHGIARQCSVIASKACVRQMQTHTEATAAAHASLVCKAAPQDQQVLVSGSCVLKWGSKSGAAR